MESIEQSTSMLPTQKCDVVIVGMGFAGLVAANRAAEQGANVTIIDKQPSGWWIGGDAILSGQCVHICSISPMLPEDQLVKIINERTGGKASPDLVNALVGNCKRAMKWLMDKGVEFEESPGLERVMKPKKIFEGPWSLIKPGGAYDATKYGGYKAMKLLESLLKERGVGIMYETKALKLLTDAKGEVAGVLVKGKEGPFEIKAKATILCTGGFQRNKEMLVRYIGPYADRVPIISGPGPTGDGHLMGLDVGAAFRSMSAIGYNIWPKGAITNEDLLYLNINPLDELAIIVNNNGERFCDESIGCKLYGSIMSKLMPETEGLIIIDEVIYEEKEIWGKKAKAIVDFVTELGGTVYKANTIKELSEKAGISPYLVATINEFNEAVDEGKASQLRIPKTGNVNKITTPPFYGIPFTLGHTSTYGGFVVSPKCEVLDRDMKPIPRLYAAGEVMQGSLSGGVDNRYASYVGQLSSCLVFGIISAENASAIGKAQ